MRKTLLVGLAHPDDEVGAAGSILAQKARGDRVVAENLHSVKWLSLFMKNIATVNIRASNWFRHFCCTISRRDSHITHI